MKRGGPGIVQYRLQFRFLQNMFIMCGCPLRIFLMCGCLQSIFIAYFAGMAIGGHLMIIMWTIHGDYI